MNGNRDKILSQNAITSENRCEQHRQETSSIDGEVEDRKESLQQVTLHEGRFHYLNKSIQHNNICREFITPMCTSVQSDYIATIRLT